MNEKNFFEEMIDSLSIKAQINLIQFILDKLNKKIESLEDKITEQQNIDYSVIDIANRRIK